MTCFHRVGIVAKYSYIVIVNAIIIRVSDAKERGTWQKKKKKKAYNKFSHVLPYIKRDRIEYHSENEHEV